jgi:hypothetical protein
VFAFKERMRQLSAIAVALCLLLPLQSCSYHGQTEVFYPLSGDFYGNAFMLAIYLLPLVGLLRVKYRIAAILVGISACLAGLYFVTYASTIWAANLLVGWYVYSAASLVYLVASAFELRRAVAANKSFKADASGAAQLRR